MEYQDEVTGSATAMAVDSGTEVAGVEGTGEVTEVSNDFISTEAYVVPPATAKYHRGSVSGVALLSTKTGSTAIVATLHSDDNGRDYELKSWAPPAWIENPRITRAQLEALPRPAGTNAKGHPKQLQVERFGAAIANSVGTAILKGVDENGRPMGIEAIGRAADVQKLLIVAKHASRSIAAGKYTTADEFVTELNSLVSGTPVIFTTREEKNDDPQFAPKETVNGIYGYDYDVSKFKKYESASGN